MILPITIYGHPVLKKRGEDITKDYPELDQLIEDMFETMYNAEGVGLAAPQINKSIRLFIIDADPFKEYYSEAEGFKKVFINPEILEEEGEEWAFTEGCLSIPEVHEEVFRKSRVLLKYYDRNFEEHQEWFEGIQARVIQHEYDHIEGILFTEKVGNITKLMIKKKLTNLKNGNVSVPYKVLFARRK